MLKWIAAAVLALAVSIPAGIISTSSTEAKTIIIKKKHAHPWMHRHAGGKVIIKKGGDED